jgi:hypothetical protein
MPRDDTSIPTRYCSKCNKSFQLRYQQELSLTVYTLGKEGNKKQIIVFFCNKKCLLGYFTLRQEIKQEISGKKLIKETNGGYKA